MGLLDNVTSAVNRGTESMGRGAEKIKLKNQIDQINKRRQQLAGQLGASLYEATKDDPSLRAGREPLYDAIAACDTERAQCQQKIDELDAISQAAAVAASSYKCVVCGATMAGDDLFCMGCGTPAAQARPAVTTAAAVSVPNAVGTCAQCGAPLAEGDMFCMSCGAKVASNEEVVVQETVVAETSPAAETEGAASAHAEGGC